MTVSLFVDNTTYLNATALNQFPAVGAGGKPGVHLVYARVRYTGSAWEVHSTTDGAVLVTGNLSWSSDHLNVTLSNFSVAPLVLAAPMLADSTLLCKVLAASASQVQLAWYSDVVTRVTVQASTMDAYLLILGA